MEMGLQQKIYGKAKGTRKWWIEKERLKQKIIYKFYKREERKRITDDR